MMASHLVWQSDTLHSNGTASSFAVGISISFLQQAEQEA
jgi:hypothetical protein